MKKTTTPRLPALTRASLCSLVEQGNLSAAAWKEALNYLGFRPDAGKWGDFWRQVLLLSGVLFLTAGLIFFIAGNWAEMHRFARLALVQVLVAGTGLAAVWRGPDSVTGRLCLLACGICVGPMLAVFGQTYQTGANLWELFRVWACVLVPLAIVGRQAALWLTTWIVSSLFVMLYMGNSFAHPEAFFATFPVLPEYMLAQTLGLIAWEAAAHVTRGNARHDWLRARWLPRLLFFSIMTSLTISLGSIVAFGSRSPWDIVTLYLPSEPTYWLLYAIYLGGGWLWYRRRVPDLFMLTCCVGSLAGLCVALLLQIQLFHHDPLLALFGWGMAIVGLTCAAGKILLHLQRQLEQESGKRPVPAKEKKLISAEAVGARWADLWAFLRTRGLVEQENPPVLPVESPPWYVQVMLTLGGWLAALLFVLFLAVSQGSHFEWGLLVEGIAFMWVGQYCLRAPSFFVRHFGFATALAGTTAAACALCLIGDSTQHWPLLATLPLLAGIVFIRHSPYCFLAALCVAVLGDFWLSSLIYESYVEYRTAPSPLLGPAGRQFFFLPGILWWTAVACAITRICTREDDWRCSPRGKETAKLFAPLAFGAYAGILMMVIMSLSISIWAVHGMRLVVSARAAGIGAGIGIMYLVFCMTETMGRSGKRWALGVLAAVAVPLGWYLPGVSAALFGMALARYMASPVLLGATGFFLFAYMIYYYYYLGLTLVHKSLTLMAVGSVLLMAGLGIKALINRFSEGEQGHA